MAVEVVPVQSGKEGGRGRGGGDEEEPPKKKAKVMLLQVKRKGESVRASASLIIVMVSVYTYLIPSNKCHGYNISQCHKSTVSIQGLCLFYVSVMLHTYYNMHYAPRHHVRTLHELLQAPLLSGYSLCHHMCTASLPCHLNGAHVSVQHHVPLTYLVHAHNIYELPHPLHLNLLWHA